MYQAIKNYCENERTNGLYLLDMPTGFGKTYNVIKYIFDASTNEANKDRKYFFITTLKIFHLSNWRIVSKKQAN